ncbi:MAG: hypothetical protein ACK4WD_06960 [Flavobacteriales bacterium]|jgi:hypothetical protein
MLRKSLVITFILIATVCSAQKGRRGMLEYAAGGRVGTGTGLTGQYFYTDAHVVEMILYARWQGFSATLLYEHHMQMFDVRGLKWYIGGGGHASLYPVGTNRPDIDNDFAGHVFLPGVDAIVGMEYFFHNVPLMISVDLKPEYNFGIVNRPDLTNGGISLRYRF